MARQDSGLEAFEAEMIEAFRLLARLPGERPRLASLQWPPMVKDLQADYADEGPPRRSGLTRSEYALVERVFLSPGCVTSVVAPERMQLCRMVLAAKAWPERRGFRWEAVWQALGGKRCGATTDTLRQRWETCLARMAWQMELLEARGAA